MTNPPLDGPTKISMNTEPSKRWLSTAVKIGEIIALGVAICAILQTNILLRLTNQTVTEMRRSNQIAVMPFISLSPVLQPNINKFQDSLGLVTELRFDYDVNVTGNAPAFNLITKSGISKNSSLSCGIPDAEIDATLSNVILPGFPCNVTSSVKLRRRVVNQGTSAQIEQLKTNWMEVNVTGKNGRVFELNEPFYLDVYCQYDDVFRKTYKYLAKYQVILRDREPAFEPRLLNSHYLYIALLDSLNNK